MSAVEWERAVQKNIALAFGLPDLSWVERPIQFVKNGSSSIEVRARIFVSDTMQLHRDYVDYVAYQLNNNPVDSKLFEGFDVEFVSLEGQGVTGVRSRESKRTPSTDGAIAGSSGTAKGKNSNGNVLTDSSEVAA